MIAVFWAINSVARVLSEVALPTQAVFWAINSVARVLPSHGRSHWFKSSIAQKTAFSALPLQNAAFTRENAFCREKRETLSVFHGLRRNIFSSNPVSPTNWLFCGSNPVSPKKMLFLFCHYKNATFTKNGRECWEFSYQIRCR